MKDKNDVTVRVVLVRKKKEEFLGTLLIPKERVMLILRWELDPFQDHIIPFGDPNEIEWRPFANEKELPSQPLLVVGRYHDSRQRGVKVLVPHGSNTGTAVIMDRNLDLFDATRFVGR